MYALALTGARAPHVEDIDVPAVPVEWVHVVQVAKIECDTQRPQRWRAAWGWVAFWWERLVDDRAMFELSQCSNAHSEPSAPT
jgi:hypothetical protein